MIGGLPGELESWTPEWSASADRRVSAARKLAMYTEAHRPLIERTIEDRMNNSEVASYVKRFTSRSPNLLRSVVDALAVVYSRGCRRELAGVGEAAARAFADVVEETGIARKANGLNARAWLAPVLAAPCLDARGRLAMDLISASHYVTRMSGDHVDATLWSVGANFVLLDAEGWSFFDSRGVLRPLSGVHNGFVPHGLSYAPAVHITAIDNTYDPWVVTAHDGLADATLDVSYLYAFGRFVRQVNGTKLTWIRSTFENLKASAGQSLGHPVLPIWLPGGQYETEIGQLDRIVPARDNLDEIAATITMAISAEGLPPGSVQMVGNNSDWGNLAISVEGNRLALLRDKQVPFLVHAERSFWPMAVDLLRESDHRHRKALPPGDEVREALRISIPDLATPKDVKERVEALEAGLPHGLTSAIDFLMAARPELTRAEAEAEITANLATYATRNEYLATRNAPADASHAGATLAQQQGRIGGETRVANAAAAAAQERP